MSEQPIDGLARALCRLGLRHAFGVTGSGRSWRLITALEARGVVYEPVHHEAAAAIMAGAMSAAGRPAAAIAIKGPGVANLLPGLAACHLEGWPALSIAEGYDADAPARLRHKRLDHDALLAPLVRAASHLGRWAEDLPALLAAARAEPPGPVHLTLADLGADAAGPGPDRDAAAGAAPTGAEPAPAEETLARIARCRKPVLIVGSLALRRPWRARLRALRCPVLTTVSAKGAVDERAPSSAGIHTGAGGPLAPETALLAEADLAIGLGLRNTEVLSARPLGPPLALLDEAAGAGAGPAFGHGFEAVSTAVDAGGRTLEPVFEALADKAWGEASIAAARRRLEARLLAPPWLPARCFALLDGVAWDHALVLDTGAFCTVGEHLWRAGPARPFLGSSNGRMMGIGLPSAIGLALSRPGLPVVCAVGDGGIGMYLAELKLALEHRLPLCLVLMRDGRYGSIVAAASAPDLSARAVTLARPSWLRAIAGLGCPVLEVTDAEAFAAAVAGWDRRSPLYLEAVFDPEPYAAMTEGLR